MMYYLLNGVGKFSIFIKYNLAIGPGYAVTKNDGVQVHLNGRFCYYLLNGSKLFQSSSSPYQAVTSHCELTEETT